VKQLKGQCAIVTGAGSGIGAASAAVLAAEGASVVALARHIEHVEEVCSAIRGTGGIALALEADVCSSASLDAAVESALAEFGRVDVLVTCAAAGPAAGPSEDLDPDAWRMVIDTDLTGVFLSCRAAGRPMLERGYGRIVNMASFHVVATYPERAAYVAAKAGVVGLTEALAVEWGGRGVTVNAVAPGPVRTPRTSWFLAQDPANEAGMIGRTPTGKLGEIEDITAVIRFLCSPAARHVTAQTVVVDGGWTKNAWWGRHPWKGDER
jgi:NAD(P)-dependent dehydrogenase (short-subunit alcohol dehydrogenase family)